MAYYTGQASSYQELLDTLIATCINHGWIYSNNRLTKYQMTIELLIEDEKNGIVAAGIDNNIYAPFKPRFGPPSSTKNSPVFPINYHFFIFDKEVYCIGHLNTDTFYFLAFGKSSLALNSGLWITATSCYAISSYYQGLVYLHPNGGGSSSSSVGTTAAPFWNVSQTSNNNSVIAHGFDNEIWSTWLIGEKKAHAVSALSPLNVRQPSNWSANSILLPIHIFLSRPENKYSLIASFDHARFTRIDHYEPMQIINYGQERWMILPFYKKNNIERNGTPDWGDHTGTFGWAIRYDGP